MTPTVSVIIPVFNQARYIGQAIESVLAQTFTDYEIIVVNDGSTDETAQILAGYGDQIQVITQTNSGLSSARNTGLRVARGELIALLDADDVWYPEMLSTTVTHLKLKPSVDLVCGAWDEIDEANQTIKPANRPTIFQANVQTDALRIIALGNLFLVHALLVRRKCFDCCGLFDTTLKAVEDWDMWLRMAVHGHNMDSIDVPVARYRRHSNNMTRDPQRMEQASEQVLTKLFSDDEVASHVEDLREHAYIAMWLTIAGFCQESGLDADRRRYVQMAEELYGNAPRNTEAGILHLGKLYQLPETEHFIQLIAATMPRAMLYHYWLRGQELLEQRDYALIRSRLNRQTIQSVILGLKDHFVSRLSKETLP